MQRHLAVSHRIVAQLKIDHRNEPLHAAYGASRLYMENNLSTPIHSETPVLYAVFALRALCTLIPRAPGTQCENSGKTCNQSSLNMEYLTSHRNFVSSTWNRACHQISTAAHLLSKRKRLCQPRRCEVDHRATKTNACG